MEARPTDGRACARRNDDQHERGGRDYNDLPHGVHLSAWGAPFSCCGLSVHASLLPLLRIKN
jgi:hypothetical protein